MKLFRLTINLEEFIGDNFKHIKSQLEVGKEHEISKLLETQTELVKIFIKKVLKGQKR